MKLLSYPFKVLIVDDEVRDWAEPMADSLRFMAKAASMAGLTVEVAPFVESARHAMARAHFHVVSLDLRLPERPNEVVSFETGYKLVEDFAYLGFPKPLIYTSVFDEQRRAGHWDDTDSVLRLPADSYAKASGTGERVFHGVPALSAHEWAERLVSYLDVRHSRMPPLHSGEAMLTVLGSYLQRGPGLFPPPLSHDLARLVAATADDEPPPTAAVMALMEGAVRLAIAQSMVLCEADGLPGTLPADDSLAAALHALGAMQPGLTEWNWSHYLNEPTLRTLREAVAHPPEQPDDVRIVLLRILDLAAYWVRHPLCSRLRFSRDGWTAQVVLGCHRPRMRKQLPAAQDFQSTKGSADTWQSVWRLPRDGSAPTPCVVPWASMLHIEGKDDTRWWLAVSKEAGETRWLDVDTRQTVAR